MLVAALALLALVSVAWQRAETARARALAEQTAASLRALGEAQARAQAELEARLAAAERGIGARLHAAVETQLGASFGAVLAQFGEIQRVMGDVRQATAQIADVKRLFANVRTRGGWGEAQVRAMLDDVLPPGAYERNVRVREDSGAMVEFAVRMPGSGGARPWLPIDAKFPTEDYERLLAASEAGDAAGERAARDGLARRIRAEARKIAELYVHPPATVEFAVMYVATDALYAEVARIPGLIDEIGRSCRVLVLGPSLFPALLRTIHLGFITLALEEKAGLVRDLLAGTKAEMLKMERTLEVVARNNAALGASIDAARGRARAVGRALRSVDGERPVPIESE